MTEPALRGASNTPAGSVSADAEFKAACDRRDYALLQDAIAGMSTRDAVDHLAAIFPHRTRRWFHRNLEALLALDADSFGRLLAYADPTGDAAANRIDAARAAA